MKKINNKFIIIGIIFLMLFAVNVAIASSPTVSNVSPSDDSTIWDISLSSLSCNLSEANGSTFNWSIDTLPDVGNSSGFGATNGSKTCTISGLEFSTTYTWYVNATQETNYTNVSYTFTTRDAKLRENSAFSGVEKVLIGFLGIVVLIAFILFISKVQNEKNISIGKVLLVILVAIIILSVIFQYL